MHDCAGTKDKIIEMLLGEIDGTDRLNLITEITECTQCARVHSSTAAALAAFDEIATSQMPDETYWPGYEATLRARLEIEQAPNRSGWLSRSAGRLRFPQSLAASLAAAFILLTLGLALRLSFREGSPVKTAIEENAFKQEESKSQTASPNEDESKTPLIASKPAGGKKKTGLVSNRSQALSKSARQVNGSGSITPLEVRVAEHVESIELLLRSFRNARPVAGESAPDVSFERTLARRMITQNNRLRHEAILSGELPVEDLLGSAEPFLLEIANLPEKPSEDQTQTIRRLLKENGIISELRLYSVALRPDYNP